VTADPTSLSLATRPEIASRPGTAGKPLGAVLYAASRLFSYDSQYPARERIVVMAVAAFLPPNGGWWTVGEEKIAKRTPYDVRTVRDALRDHCNGPLPLIERRRTRILSDGRPLRRPCYQYRLVRNPSAFSEARDKARADALETSAEEEK